MTLRTDMDYGPDLTFQNLPQVTPVTGVKLTLWGNPPGPSHDSQRFPAGSAGEPAGCPGVEGTSCLSGSTPSSIVEMAMLHNPTDCSGPPQSRLDAITYQSNVVVSTASMPGRTGCGNLFSSPMLLAGLTTTETNNISGLDLGFLDVPEG